MTSRRLVGFALCLMLAAAAHGAVDATGPTFYEHVLPILQENCQECHRPSAARSTVGGVPMSLTTFEEARPWARAIVRQTASKEMPPWDASEHFDGVFRNERGLTDAEIATIQLWGEAGAQPGRPENGPEPIDWPTTRAGSSPIPTWCSRCPSPTTSTTTPRTIYTKHRLVLTEDLLPEDKWVQEIEFRRGSELVHHFNIFVKGPNDEETRGDGDYLGGATSGSPPHVWPEGYGSLLEVGDTLTFDLHYHKEPGPGSGGWDQSSIALKFATSQSSTPSTSFPISNFEFEIPAGHDYWHDSAERTFDREVTILGMLPHMHMRGRESKYTAFYPDGSEELILHVPDWNFDWQEILPGTPSPRCCPRAPACASTCGSTTPRRGGTLGLQSRSQRGVRPAVDRRDADGLHLLRLQRRGGAAGESGRVERPRPRGGD